MKNEMIRPTTGVNSNNERKWVKRMNENSCKVKCEARSVLIDGKEYHGIMLPAPKNIYKTKNKGQEKRHIVHTSYGLDAQLLGVPMTMAILGIHDLRGLCGAVDQPLIRA